MKPLDWVRYKGITFLVERVDQERGLIILRRKGVNIAVYPHEVETEEEYVLRRAKR